MEQYDSYLREVFLDLDVIDTMIDLYTKGHQIKIVTAAIYQFAAIEAMLATYGINLARSDYFNRHDIVAKTGEINKAAFIDSEFPSSNVMLFDDQSANKPTPDGR